MRSAFTASRAASDVDSNMVRERLAEFGLEGVDRLRLRGLDQPHAESEIACRLKSAIESLGPVFRCFGRYVAARPDLMDAAYCVQLGDIEDRRPASPSRDVASWIERELGDRCDRFFDQIEDRPIASSFAFQIHRGRLRDGRRVTIKLTRPDAREVLDGSCAALRELRGALGLREIQTEIADFRRGFVEGLDLTNQRVALEALADNALSFEWQAAFRPEPELCTSAMLTSEAPAGPTLAEVIASLRTSESNVVYHDGICIHPAEAARLLCVVWLRQALAGHAFAADPAPEQIVFAPYRKVAISGDRLTSLDRIRQAGVHCYLLAAANDDPGTAATYLERDLTLRSKRGTDVDLERRFRQLVPFRDGGWSEECPQNLTAEIFCQWHAAGQMGYSPCPQLAAVYSGFTRIAMWSRALSPDGDPIREALRELRLATAFSKAFSATEPANAQEFLMSAAELTFRAPRGMNDLLRLGLPDEFSGRPKLRTGSGRTSIAVIAGLIAIFLWLELLFRTWRPANGSIAEAASIAALGVAGVALLTLLARL